MIVLHGFRRLTAFPDGPEDDDVIVDPDPEGKDGYKNIGSLNSYRGPGEEIQNLAEELSEGKKEYRPDEHDPELVEDGPGGGVQLLGHGGAGPIEDRNGGASCCSHQDPGVSSYHRV